MTYIPKKVFILRHGEYVEISYEEFCSLQEGTAETEKSAESEKACRCFYIAIQGMLLEVPEDAYREHYQICRRVRYLTETEEKTPLLSFEACIEAGFESRMLFFGKDKTPETVMEEKDEITRLHTAIERLSAEEKELILSHFFFHASQKELAKRFGVTQSAISRRIKSILCKLRNEIGE